MLSAHYGKWYLDPKDFNESMANYKSKIMQDSIIRDEIDNE